MKNWITPAVTIRAKHVGHKVAVTGLDSAMAMGKDTMGKGMPAWSVTSLKMVAATCGM